MFKLQILIVTKTNHMRCSCVYNSVLHWSSAP